LGHQNPPESGIKQAKKILINRFIGASGRTTYFFTNV
jgi:hypothetical protein